MTEYEELANLYCSINDAMVAKDIKKLREIILDGAVLVHMTGYVQPVEEWYQQIESEDMLYYSWQEESIKDIYIEGNRASLIGQSRVKARIWGVSAYTWPLQIKVSFEKKEGKWYVSKQLASTY